MVIRTYPRIHLTLVDFTKGGYRKFGGIGFSIDLPMTSIVANPSSKFSFEYKLNGVGLNYSYDSLAQTVVEVAEEFQFGKKVAYEFMMKYPPHSGLGTGTNFILASLEALFYINKTPVENKYLIKLSKRGRTSGVGIQTYFNGGYVFDVGVKNTDDIFLPSNANASDLIAVPIISCALPSWRGLLCLPKLIPSIDPGAEKAFFVNKTPISQFEVQEILYHATMGISAAILEGDFETFCRSLKAIQTTKWKKMERNLYGNQISRIEASLYNLGAKAVAMSSLGPTLVAFSEDMPSLSRLVKKNMADQLALFDITLNNNGREIDA